MAHGQVAQPQELGNRYLRRAGQAGAALAAALTPKPPRRRCRQAFHRSGHCGSHVCSGRLGGRWVGPAGLAAGGRQPPGPGQIARLGCPQGEGGDPRIQQEAVGQFQGLKGLAVGDQLRRGVVEPAAFVGGRDGHHADAIGQGLAGDGHPGLIKEMEVEAAELKDATAQGGLDQPWAAMAGEAHLAHQAFGLGPLQQVGAGAV